MAFKVGDRVLSIGRGLGHKGQRGTVDKVSIGGRYWIRFDDGARCFYDECNLNLAEPLKLEVGATVTIGDGKDEWLVRYVGITLVDLRRNGVDVTVGGEKVTVVKAKPEPTDYYVNCKGAEPKQGDVFTDGHSEKHTYYVHGNSYYIVGSGCGKFGLRDRDYRHSVNSTWGGATGRSLVVRDGKPYTGNV